MVLISHFVLTTLSSYTVIGSENRMILVSGLTKLTAYCKVGSCGNGLYENTNIEDCLGNIKSSGERKGFFKAVFKINFGGRVGL